MHKKGAILLVLMLMLLFASPLLLQLGEDNYFMRLLSRQVDDLTQSRQALVAVFNTLSKQSLQASACETSAYSQAELEDFWSTSARLCQMTSSGVTVKYAFYRYEQEGKEASYQQYTLYARNSWLRVVVNMQTRQVVSWVYY